jgi:hypothetical protein
VAAEIIEHLVPHRLGVDNQARLENVFLHNQRLFARCAQYLAECCWQKGSSFHVSLGFYAT